MTELTQIVREIAIGGLAALLAAVPVIGLGGRVFMRVAAVLDPEATGRVTSSGNRIGDITPEGTLALVLFAGLFFGLLAAVLWVVVAPWLPGAGAMRAAASAGTAVALSSFFVVSAQERDFRLLEPALASVVMVLSLVALLGASISLLDEYLKRRLPPAEPLNRWLLVYTVVAAVGLLLAPFAVLAYFATDVAAASPPTAVGAALVAVGLATLSWWCVRIIGGRRVPPRSVTVLGRGALLLAVVLGTVRLATEIGGILG